jgi:hypothetical protein
MNIMSSYYIDRLPTGHHEFAASRCPPQASFIRLVLGRQCPYPPPRDSAHCWLCPPDNPGRESRNLVRALLVAGPRALFSPFSPTPSVLQNITIGHLRIITSKRVYEFPAQAGEDVEPRAELRVLNDAFWVRLCTMGDLGFAEAYMFGDVACDDLISTFLVGPLSFPPANW